MKLVAGICNVVLLGFTGLVLAVDGAPTQTVYIVLTVIMFLVPVLSLVAIFGSDAVHGRLQSSFRGEAPKAPLKIGGRTIRCMGLGIAAAIGNLVLFAFVCWAIASQYPHPREDGVVEYTLLVLLTPVITLVTIWRGGARSRLATNV